MTEHVEPPVLELVQPRKRKPSDLLAQDIVSRLMEPGLDRQTLSSQVRKYTRLSYLAPRAIDANDGRNPYLFELDSALIAKVLTLLADTTMDLGAGNDGPACVGRAVSNALKNVHVADHFPGGVPKGLNPHVFAHDFGGSYARRVLFDWQRGVQGWSLHVRWFYDDQGQKRCVAKMWNVTEAFMPNFLPNGDGVEPLPHAETIISMDRILPIITRDRAGMN